MELGSIVIGIITLACFIVPVVYLQNVQKKKKKVFLKNFISLAGQHQINVTQHDFWNHGYAIGLDPVKNQLFYQKKQEGNEQTVIINLQEVEKCSLINQSRVVNDNKIIDLLELSFTFRHGKQPEKKLEFYNKEQTMSITDELKLLEKWKSLIDARLQEIAKGKSSIELKKEGPIAA